MPLCDELLLYAVTDRSWESEHLPFLQQVETVLSNGATILQLREKNSSKEEIKKLAKSVQQLTKRYGVPFIINDHADIAIAIGADGVHVGQEDEQAKHTRKKIGNEKILGVSVQTLEQALQAEADGADYLGVGAVFPTTSKQDVVATSMETVAAICKSVKIPVVAIGGISLENAVELKDSGVSGVAVISALFAEKDIAKATRDFRLLSEDLFKK